MTCSQTSSKAIRKHNDTRYNYHIKNTQEILMRSILEELYYGNICPTHQVKFSKSNDKLLVNLSGYICRKKSYFNENSETIRGFYKHP